MDDQLRRDVRSILDETIRTNVGGTVELVAADRLEDAGHPLALVFREWARMRRDVGGGMCFATTKLSEVQGEEVYVALSADASDAAGTVNVSVGFELPGPHNAGANADEPGFHHWQVNLPISDLSPILSLWTESDRLIAAQTISSLEDEIREGVGDRHFTAAVDASRLCGFGGTT